jgi:putative MATE family efflux protein
MADLLARVRNHESLSSGERFSLVCRLGAPAIMAQVTSVVMQYIDASMVGRLGADSSAAIGLVATTTWLFGSLCTFATSGFTIQVAQLVGASRMKDARTVMRNAFYVVPLASIILTVIGIAISGGLPLWLGGSEAIRGEASGYFLVYVCSLIAAALNSLAGGMLSVSGNLKVPGILNSLMCVLDVVFNAFLIFDDLHIVLPLVGGVHICGAGLGVVGAALGTALAEAVIMLFMNYFLWFRTPLLGYVRGERHPFTACYVVKAGKLAIPIAFERLVVCGAMIATTRIVAPLGIVSIAANSFAVTAESLCYMPAYGISEAATTLVGQSIGAGRGRLAWSFGKITLVLGMLLMALTGVLMYVLAPWMMSLLTPDERVRELGVAVLRIEAYAEPLYGASIVATGVLRGAGDTLVPSILNLVSLWGVRIPLSMLLAGDYGLRGVWMAMAAELCVRGMLYIVRCVVKMRKEALIRDV